MVLQGDESQVEARFDLFGDSSNLCGRQVRGLRRTYHGLRNHFGCTEKVLLGDKAQVEAHFGLF